MGASAPTRWGPRLAAILAAALVISMVASERADASELRGGAGRADITPPTGFYLFGWVRSDARSQGQLTRLQARAIVLERGRRKVALVSVDLGAVPNGLVVDIAERLAPRGYRQEDLIVTASHTHSAPAGYFNYPAFNTVAPTSTTPTDFELSAPADRRLYTFLVERIATAVLRADRDLGPAAAGWGTTRLLGLTENRSIEAHLANHGIHREFGHGHVSLDPLGYAHTISPRVEVLRVDKVTGSGRMPIGIWSTFANHGTVVKPTFPYYNADHHGSAARVAEARIRRIGRVPRNQEVVNSYGNSDQGDITAGLRHSGPAGAHEVGRTEALAMVRAWRRAGPGLRRRPALRMRWTRVCFCGRDSGAGQVDDRAVVGWPFLTGSEENRGPLYDETGVPFEGHRLPASVGPQGNKLQVIRDTGQFPTAIPLSALRVGDRVVVTVPGEMSSGMGRRLRQRVLAAASGSGVRAVAVSGLANDFIQYFTTPEEYGMQHYEGGSTLFGRASGVFIAERLAGLARAVVRGRPAPRPDPLDPRNGVRPDGAPYPAGARTAVPGDQPSDVRRLEHTRFSWSGGERGYDRPLDRAFVTIQRRTARGWRRADDDLDLRVLWTVDEEGGYEAIWEPALGARTGRHRFVVRANGYRLRSQPFRLRPSDGFDPVVASLRPGRTVLRLHSPVATENEDLAWRPHHSPVGRAIVRGGGPRVKVRVRRGRAVVTGPSGTHLRIPRGGLRDRHGNRNRYPYRFML